MSKRPKKTPADPLAELNATPPPPGHTAPHTDESNEAQAFLDQSPMPTGNAEPQAPDAQEEITVYQWMRTFTAAEWQRIMCYVYRKRPFFEVDTSDGRPIYAMKFSEPFDEDDLKRVCGSGKYQLRFNITPPQGGSSRNLRTVDVFIFDLRFPPMLPAGPWLDNPRNQEWKSFRAAIEEREAMEAAERRRRVATLDNPPTTNNNQEEEESMSAAATQQITEVLRETQKRLAEVSDPERQLKTLASLAEVLRPPTVAPPPAAADSGTKEMMAILRDELKHAREQATKAEQRVFELLSARQAPPPQKTFAEQAAEFGEIAKTLGYRRAGAQDENGSDSMWAGIFERAIDAAPDLIAAFMSRPTSKPTARTIDAQVEQVAPSSPEPQQQQEADSADTAEAEELPGDPTLTDEDKKLLTQFEPLLRNLVPNLIKGVKKGDPGEGYNLQRFFLDEFGKQALLGLKGQIGAERMARLAYGDPTIRAMLMLPPNAVDQATVQAFLEDFFDYPRTKPAQGNSNATV